MTIQSATPYFILNGKAPQAIEFYLKALGATLEHRQTFGEVDGSCPEAKRDLVMHAVLRFGKTLVMLSDGPGEGPLSKDGVVSVALDFDDASELRRVFDALAVGGSIFTNVMDAPWGALFGVVTDRYGITWMVNCMTKKG
jgi:PhnB protein